MVTHHYKSRSSRMKNINKNGVGINGFRTSILNTGEDFLNTGEDILDRPFLMPVEDVSFIPVRGTVVYGRIERGIIKMGEDVEIVGIRDTRKSVVIGVEMFRKILDEGRAGDNVGLLLRGIENEEDIERGMVICKPGSLKPYKKFKANIHILKKEEGGLIIPFFNNYKPQFYFRNKEFRGEFLLPSGLVIVMPGDNVEDVIVTLSEPVAMETGLKFDIREGGRTVGSGVITVLINTPPLPPPPPPRYTLILFIADWCGPCRIIKPIFKEVSADNDLSIIEFKEINVDFDSIIARKYNVERVPMMILIDNDKKTEIDRFSILNKDSIIMQIKSKI
jgi:thiol-disulfide isomerase/thioredoxin